jgi:hypothetical protein
MLNSYVQFWFGRDARINLRSLQILWAFLVLFDIHESWLPAFDFLFQAPGVFRQATDTTYLRWWNIFAYADSDKFLNIALCLLVASLFCLIVGFRRGRAGAMAVYLLACFHHISPMIWVPYYDLLRFSGLLLILVDLKTEWPNLWILRLIQIQFSIVYLVAALAQVQSLSWLTGEASLFVLQSASIAEWVQTIVNVWMPWPFMFRLMSWCVIGIEAFVAVGLWIPRTRRFAILTALMYNVLLMMIFVSSSFQWIMIFGLATFVDWKAVVERVRKFAKFFADRRPTRLATARIGPRL